MKYYNCAIFRMMCMGLIYLKSAFVLRGSNFITEIMSSQAGREK